MMLSLKDRSFPAGRFMLTALLLAVLGLAQPARASFIHKGGVALFARPAATGTGDCTAWANACTLQQALEKAADGDEIWVAAGTHLPTTGADRTATFTLKDGVAVYGGFAGTETHPSQRNWTAHETILSGDIGTPGDPSDNSYHVVTTSGRAASAVLDGFTIRDGNADGDRPHFSGGGLFNEIGSPTLAHLVVRENMATWYGGGMYSSDGSPSLSQVNFTLNSAIRGEGGGLYNYEGEPALTDVMFIGNKAEAGGGGMANQKSNPRLVQVVFYDNSAAGGGGGMANDSCDQPILVGVTFTTNRAPWGGGLYNWSCHPSLTNVVMLGNLADNEGGGIYNELSSPSLVNVTMVANRAPSSGGGMYSLNTSNPTVANSILWGNQSGYDTQIYTDSGSSTTVRYSIVQGGYAGTSVRNVDPLFVRNPVPPEDWFWGVWNEFGNLHLQRTSPAIDAGDNAVVPGIVSSDLNGQARFTDIAETPDSGSGAAPVVDLGAYEAAPGDWMNKLFLPLAVR